MVQIFSGIIAEGSTDIRFLKPIIEKTLIALAIDCRSQIDTEVFELAIEKSGKNFVEQVLEAATLGESYAINLLFVHTDADDINSTATYRQKIEPAIAALLEKDERLPLVAVIPVQEIESWMLADKKLLKEEIGTIKTDAELGIDRSPESIAKPKEIIEEAIRIARADFPKKRRTALTLAALYQPIGTKLEIDSLLKLSSFQDFMHNLRTAFIRLNLIKE